MESCHIYLFVPGLPSCCLQGSFMRPCQYPAVCAHCISLPSQPVLWLFPLRLLRILLPWISVLCPVWVYGVSPLGCMQGCNYWVDSRHTTLKNCSAALLAPPAVFSSACLCCWTFYTVFICLDKTNKNYKTGTASQLDLQKLLPHPQWAVFCFSCAFCKFF